MAAEDDQKQADRPDSAGQLNPPPWLLRAFLLAAATVAGFVATFWLLQQLQGLLTVLMVSLFLAFAIEPAVNWLARHGWRRGPATGVVFMTLLLVVVAFVWTLGSLLVEQVTTLVENAPRYADEAVDLFNKTFKTDMSGDDIEKYATEWSSNLEGYAVGLAGNVWGIGTTAVAALFQALGVLLFTYYFAADGPRFRNAVCSLLPPSKQRHVLRTWDIAVEKTGGYIYSRGLLALVSTLAHYIMLRVFDVPSAFALALWVGVVSQFIPTVGTYLAGALPVIVAVVNNPPDGLWVLGFIILYQQFENYVLQPRITATTLDMHPAVAFGAVLAGAAILGPTGALLAIPVTATLQAFAGAYIRRYDVEVPTGNAPPPLPKPERPHHRLIRLRRGKSG
ncbi:AI-2E family transporter [Nocardia cyriacigeorgica]|uniref:AI-2E family transporter n=1 Tax=Nocardia cyriacigeorgica TaxID=135487 RepID=A0A6P1D0I0_9NOCA|nr:AI-2E family transporter [Nocardia cyriacigeorgica]NEW39552.1 AI-2E family transporter [Nocardia cyriacigeorgica]NEW43966.1 AI-2E family transporter [Nocardia cyriacigeorgica]NEW50041.1 AI-2E family transporter [Nocardia cyriacigeorgica]NEW56514.1 AI-2E family transporter [Nocardia cyriacigeorgica]